MRLLNEAKVHFEWIDKMLDRADLRKEKLLIFFDPSQNRVRIDAAGDKIKSNEARGWKPYTWDIQTVAKGQDADIHAAFAPAELLSTQQLPEYVKQQAQPDESLIYIDRVFLSDQIDALITFAHECRHAWQYYNHPIVFFGDLVLSWVTPPASTPAEIDAETFAKRTAFEILGPATVKKFAQERLNSVPENHRWMWQRFLDMDQSASYDCVNITTKALLDKASEMKSTQIELDINFPHLERVAGYLPDDQRSRFLASARKA
jgi:hypothetical protein